MYVCCACSWCVDTTPEEAARFVSREELSVKVGAKSAKRKPYG